MFKISKNYIQRASKRQNIQLKGVITMLMSDKTYDILKYIAQIVLPAIAALYAALAGIWGFPYGEEIVGTISALDLFMGTLLKISKDKYDKDALESTDGDPVG